MLGSGGWQAAPMHFPPAGSITRTGCEWFPHALFGIPIVLSSLSIAGGSFSSRWAKIKGSTIHCVGFRSPFFYRLLVCGSVLPSIFAENHFPFSHC